MIQARHGYLNLLVNNAGVAMNLLPALPTPQTGDIRAFRDAMLGAGHRDDFATTFDVNVTSAFYSTLLFLELLDAGNKRGNMPGVTSQVISVASVGAFRRDDKVFTASYTFSKAAAVHMGKLLANYLKDWQIRSNVICPGVFPSGLSRQLLCSHARLNDVTFFKEMMTDKILTEQLVKTGIPLGRIGNIDDMAGLTLYLASRVRILTTSAKHIQADAESRLVHTSTARYIS